MTATGAFTGSGTDTVTIKAVAVRMTRQLDTESCAVTEKDTGTWVITKGTGALAKAKGAGHIVATTNATGTPDASKPHGCDLSHPTGTVVVDAEGRVKG